MDKAKNLATSRITPARGGAVDYTPQGGSGKIFQLALATMLATQLTACTTFSLASTGTYLATGKSLTDRALEQAIPYSDCTINNLAQGLNYCEVQDPGKTYNRGSF
jgi:hypothetical protein